MCNEKSVEACLNDISDLKQQIREYHNEMKSDQNKSIDYMKIIGDIELEIINNINKINKK